jgi:phage I-like protein
MRKETYVPTVADDHIIDLAVAALYHFEKNGQPAAAAFLARLTNLQLFTREEEDGLGMSGMVRFVQTADNCIRMREYRRLQLVALPAPVLPMQ